MYWKLARTSRVTQGRKGLRHPESPKPHSFVLLSLPELCALSLCRLTFTTPAIAQHLNGLCAGHRARDSQVMPLYPNLTSWELQPRWVNKVKWLHVTLTQPKSAHCCGKGGDSY